jgi:hypothetical protein
VSTTNDYVTLVYEQEHPTLGLVRMEVTPKGHGPVSVKTFINDQFVARGGVNIGELDLKGFTLVERRPSN